MNKFNEEVYDFNLSRNLLEKFKADTEVKMLLEEVVEAKIKDKEIVKKVVKECWDIIKKNSKNDVTMEDFMNALIDIKFIATGSQYKLLSTKHKYHNKDTLDRIIDYNESEVCRCNSLKSFDTDENGKIIKPDNFDEPETLLNLKDINKRLFKK